MNFVGTCCIKINVVEVRTFDRRSKNHGQEIIFTTDNGYRCSVSAPDQEVIDLSSCKGEIEFIIEPCTGYDKFVSSSGKQYAKNYPTFKVVDLYKDIDLS